MAPELLNREGNPSITDRAMIQFALKAFDLALVTLMFTALT